MQNGVNGVETGAKMGLKVGIIGGTGLDNPEILKDSFVKDPDTPFGKPSSVLTCGTIASIPVVILSRHGRAHSYHPGAIPYRANIYALKQEGCTHILVSNACGSLQENYSPGDIVIHDQFIDRTKGRHSTFYDETCSEFRGVCHIPMREPFSAETRSLIHTGCKSLGYKFHSSGTIVAVEGPRYSSYAEAKLYQSWGAHTIGMTTCPEVVLANELGIPYASIGLVTDYDCWKTDETQHVDAQLVVQRMKTFGAQFVQLVRYVIENINDVKWEPVLERHRKDAATAVM